MRFKIHASAKETIGVTSWQPRYFAYPKRPVYSFAQRFPLLITKGRHQSVSAVEEAMTGILKNHAMTWLKRDFYLSSFLRFSPSRNQGLAVGNETTST